MLKNFLFFRNNFFLKRIFSIRNSIFAYSSASLFDIFIILKISSIFVSITSEDFEGDIFRSVFLAIILVFVRTFIVFYLRKYAFREVFYKKLIDEKNLVRNFIKFRFKQKINSNKELKIFKEKIINSSNLAVVNFDIPFFSIIAELIFAFGGIFILLKIFGFKLLAFNLPIFFILIFFSKYVSRKLKILGNKILNFTEKRINAIDNISEIALELSMLENQSPLLDYFTKVNKPFNQILSQQTIISNMTQIYTESSAFIIILICLISLITNITEADLANTATSLIVLSRLVPSFTRSVCFITQLQFGIPCIRELSKVYKYSNSAK